MMRSFLKKALSILAVATLSISAIQAADEYDSCNSCCTPRVEPCYGYAYNPGVFVTDCCGWYANIAFVYWKPSQEGISAGTLNSLSENPAGVPITTNAGFDFIGVADAQQVYPKFDWDSGFRIGIGYHLPCDSWSLGLEYTHYRTDSHTTNGAANSNTTTGTTPPGIQGTMFAPAYSAFFDSASYFNLTQATVGLDWRIQYNQLDLDFGREFYVARTMTIRPHSGLRALFINESYDISTFGSGFSTTFAVIQMSEAITMKNDFKGVGLEGGLDLTFDLGCDLSLYSEIGGGATFGTARVTQRDNASNQFGTTTLSNSQPISYRVKDNYDTLLCNADFAFGLRRRQRVNCDQNVFSINVGYEEHIFFGYNRFRNLIGPGLQDAANNSPTGNLSFYGIVFAAAIDF